MEPIYWLILFAVLLILEFLTMGLTTIWFAGGAIAAMVAALAGTNHWIQWIVFLAVSFLMLLVTRPFAAKYINGHHVRTNAEELIGENAVVTETIDNLKNTGKAQVNGLEWTARAERGGCLIENGKIVKILAIEGVKLIVKEKEN